MSIDLSRLTSGVNLPASVANDVWARAQQQSAIMQAARQMDLPGVGIDIPIISGDATASWVNETDEKPISRPALSNKVISAYMATVIVPFSNQLKRDANLLYNTIVGRLPLALAKLFDQTAMGLVAAPGSNFDTLASAPAVSLTTIPNGGSVYGQFVSGLSSAITAGADVEAWVLSPQAELTVLGALDTTNRPIFTQNVDTDGSVGSILGRPVYYTKAAYSHSATSGTKDQLGVAGPFQSEAVWGQTSEINISISDQATLNDNGTTINLWQRNMSAARVEVEYGFRVYNVNDFVRFTGAQTA